MKRGVLVAVFVTAACLLPPSEAGSAGVHENAVAESAFLLAPGRVVARAGVETGQGESLDASVYRFYAAFPIRGTFLVAIEQPFVSVAGASGIEAGLGDVAVRLRARLAGQRRALWFAGALGGGTGERRFFPYSSEAIDIGASLAYTDSLGVLDVFAAAGVVWAQRVPDELAGIHDDYRRAMAGAGIRLGAAVSVSAGAVFHRYPYIDARREVVFAGATCRWSEALRVFAGGQAETGPPGDRASDWVASAGVTVQF